MGIKLENQMTLDQQHQLEWDHSCYIDASTLMFNEESEDATYGWAIIPLEWLQAIGYDHEYPASTINHV